MGRGDSRCRIWLYATICVKRGVNTPLVIYTWNTSVAGNTVCSQGKEFCGRRSEVTSHLVNMISYNVFYEQREAAVLTNEAAGEYSADAGMGSDPCLSWSRSPALPAWQSGFLLLLLMSLPAGSPPWSWFLSWSRLICVPCESRRVPSGLSPVLSIFNPSLQPQLLKWSHTRSS